MEIAVGMHQNQGKREYQQDMMSIKNFGSIGVLAILADGMGGYEGGEIASKLISDNFREFTIEGEDLATSLQKYLLQGNHAIAQYKEENPTVSNMGSTAIAFFLTDKTCQWISVGDSPLYVIRNRSTISRINENHSVAGLLDLQVKNGDISQEEALANPQKHMLTSAVSGEKISQMDLSLPWQIKKNDIFILASDGIETISNERIKEIVLKYAPVVTQKNMQNACEALVQEVLSVNKKNQDNVTVILLAKIENNEPKTVLYNESPKSFFDNKKKLALYTGIAGVIFALLIFISFFLGDDINKLEADKNANTKELVKMKDKTKKIDSEPKKEVKSLTNKEENITKAETIKVPEKIKSDIQTKKEQVSQRLIDKNTDSSVENKPMIEKKIETKKKLDIQVIDKDMINSNKNDNNF